MVEGYSHNEPLIFDHHQIMPLKFKKASFFAYFFYVLTGISLILQSYNEEWRYIKYFLPLVLLIAYLPTVSIKKKLKINEFLLQQMKLYGIMIGWSFIVLLFRGFTVRFLQEIYFVFSPLLTLAILQQLTNFESLEKRVNVVFYMLIIADVVFTGPNFFSDIVELVSSLPNALLTSVSSTESPYAFDFGLFAIYYFAKGRKMNCLLALIFTLISFKRIALLGVTLAFLTFFLLKRFYKNPKHSRKVLLAATFVNVFIVINLYLFSSGSYDDLIERVFGVSANYLSQGRYELYQGIFEEIHLSTLCVGLGFGFITHYLTINDAFLVNLHSDVLKIFLEFGAPFFVFWIFQLYKKTSKELGLLIMTLYLNIMFLTDNVFIYFDVMLFYYLLVILIKQNSKKKNISPDTVGY